MSPRRRRTFGARARPRVHPLHVGLDRGAQGRDALPPNALAFVELGGRRVRRDRGRPPLEPRAAPLRPLDLRPVRRGRCRRGGRARPAAAGPVPGRARPVDSTTSAITIWYSVPSILTLLVCGDGSQRRSCRRCGRSCSPGRCSRRSTCTQLMAELPHARFANLFGPTETNVCTWYEVPRWRRAASADPDRQGDHGGRGVRGHRGRTLDPAPGRSVSSTSAGRRSCRATGATTSERDATLIRDWQGEVDGYPVYRTGDLAQLDENGDWIFLGRRDRRSRAGATGSSSATSRQRSTCTRGGRVRRRRPFRTKLVTNRIKAFVVTREALDEEELSRFCSGQVPRYMTPEVYEFRDELPRSSTGKIDRRALSTPSNPGD